MKYENSKHKIKTIWNDTYYNENEIFKLEDKFTKIKDFKEVSTLLKNKKIHNFLYEDSFGFDSYYPTGGWYGANYIIEFTNLSKIHINFVKSVLLVELPENTTISLDELFINKMFVQLEDDTENQIGFNYIVGCIFRLDEGKLDENNHYIEYDISYKLIISICNQKEYT